MPGNVSGVDEQQKTLPTAYELRQNYPNPFNAQTAIEYFLPKAGHVSIDIYDLLGNRLESLKNEVEQAGNYQVIWNGQDKPSKVYFSKIQAGDFSQTKQMLLLK
jgi:hypothetical protein